MIYWLRKYSRLKTLNRKNRRKRKLLAEKYTRNSGENHLRGLASTTTNDESTHLKSLDEINPKGVPDVAQAIAIRRANPRIQHLALLYDVYKPDCFYFECVVCVKRFLLTSVTIVVTQSANSRCLFALVVALGSMTLVFTYLPYIARNDNWLGANLELILVLNYICTFALIAQAWTITQCLISMLLLIATIFFLMAYTVYMDIEREKRAVVLEADGETLLAIAGGTLDPDDAEADGALRVDGDRRLYRSSLRFFALG